MQLFVCVRYCHAVSPLTPCYIITPNDLIALFTCFTQVLPYQTYCLLDPNTKVGSCMCVQHTLLAQHCMAQWHTCLVSHPLLEASPQTIIGYFLPFLVTLDTILKRDGCHIMTFIMSFLLFLPMPTYSVRLHLFQQSLAKELWEPFSEGDTFV